MCHSYSGVSDSTAHDPVLNRRYILVRTVSIVMLAVNVDCV